MSRLLSSACAVAFAANVFALSSPFALAASGDAVVPDIGSVRYTQQQNAPQTHDFSIGPTRFELTVAPGHSRTIEIELMSQEGEDANFRLYTEDFSGGETAGQTTKLYGALDGPFPAKTWVKSLIGTLALKHGQRAFIPVTITVPPDAEPGDHYAALVAQRDPSDAQKNAPGFQVIARVASLFLISVPGEVVEKGQVTNIKPTAPVYFSYPVQVTVTGQNDGTVHISPTGTIVIRNILGLVVDELPLRGWIILRHAVNTVTLDWQPRFALGRYTATTNLTVLGQTQTLSTSFWVIPALPVLIALFLIFFVSFVVQYFFSKFEIRKK